MIPEDTPPLAAGSFIKISATYRQLGNAGGFRCVAFTKPANDR